VTEPIFQETPRKPVTVNWRDIRATIQQKTLSVKKTVNPSDPVEDPLKCQWLDDGLPELFGYNHREFDPALQFNIRDNVDILADSVSDPPENIRQ